MNIAYISQNGGDISICPGAVSRLLCCTCWDDRRNDVGLLRRAQEERDQHDHDALAEPEPQEGGLVAA